MPGELVIKLIAKQAAFSRQPTTVVYIELLVCLFACLLAYDANDNPENNLTGAIKSNQFD